LYGREGGGAAAVHCSVTNEESARAAQDPGTGRLSLLLQGLEEGRNNVYVINVVVRDDATGERAPYKFLTLQMRTAKYEPPELSGGAIGLLVGLSVGLVVRSLRYPRRRCTASARPAPLGAACAVRTSQAAHGARELIVESARGVADPDCDLCGYRDVCASQAHGEAGATPAPNEKVAPHLAGDPAAGGMACTFCFERIAFGIEPLWHPRHGPATCCSGCDGLCPVAQHCDVHCPSPHVTFPPATSCCGLS